MLTPKQQAFCEYYIACHNATQAAIKAGYSKDTARSIGAENLTKPDIQKYIEEIANKATTSHVASAQEVLTFLSSVMSSKEERTSDRLKAANMLADHYKLLNGEKQDNGKSQLDRLCDTLAQAVNK